MADNNNNIQNPILATGLSLTLQEEHDLRESYKNKHADESAEKKKQKPRVYQKKKGKTQLSKVPMNVLEVAVKEPIVKNKEPEAPKVAGTEVPNSTRENSTKVAMENPVTKKQKRADEMKNKKQESQRKALVEVAATVVGEQENLEQEVDDAIEIILNKLRRKRKQPDAEEEETTAPQKKRKKRVPTGYVNCRTSPSGIFNLIPHLNVKQKESIREIGFAGLLHLSTEENNLQLITFLIERFNCKRCSFQFENGDELKIDEEDVELIFDVPRGPKSVSETLSKKDDEQFDDFVKAWQVRWKIKKGQAAPLTGTISETLVQRLDSGDKFKQDFMVLVVTSLFRSLQGRRANYKMLKVLQEVKNIKEYNWCAFMRQSLVASVEEFRESKAKNKYFSGPGLLMMLCYLDRMEFRIRRENSRVFPICSNWEKSEIDKRVRKEKELGGFGQGKVVEKVNRASKTEKVIFLKESEKEKKMDKKKEEDKEKEKDFGEQAEDNSPTAKLSRVLKKMTGAVNEMRETMEEMGKEPQIANDILMTPFELILSAKEKEEKEKEEKNPTPKTPTQENTNQINPIQNIPPEKKEFPTFSILDDDAFLDPVLAADIFAFWDACSKPKKVTKIQMVSDAFDGPSFSLGLEDIEPMGVFSSDSDTEEKKQEPIRMESIGDDDEDENIVNTPIAEADFNSILQESEDDVVDVIHRKNPVRTCKNLPLLFRSPFWTENKVKLEKFVSVKEKMISEYAFFQQKKEIVQKDNKILFDAFGIVLRRSEFCTLSDDQWVVQTIVDAWCIKLNNDNKRRALSEPNRVFFSTMAHDQMEMDLLHNEPKENRCFGKVLDNELKNVGILNIDDADIVFFPIIREHHYWILCFNFKNNVIQIIDNRPMQQHSSVPMHYSNDPRRMTNAFAEYLEDRGLKKNISVRCFWLAVVKMPWRSSSNFNDCGVYCMRHLETYKGELVKESWEAGFKKDEDRNFLNALRAKYCSTLIMMKENVQREQVLKDAKDVLRLKLPNENT